MCSNLFYSHQTDVAFILQASRYTVRLLAESCPVLAGCEAWVDCCTNTNVLTYSLSRFSTPKMGGEGTLQQKISKLA